MLTDADTQIKVNNLLFICYHCSVNLHYSLKCNNKSLREPKKYNDNCLK